MNARARESRMPNNEPASLPEWPDCARAVHSGRATALESFLFDHQPSEAVAAMSFRRGLASLLDHKRAAEAPVAPPPAAPPAKSAEPVVLLEWIRLGRYCELTGDTSDAVHARRRKRQWIDGTHCKVCPCGNLWVNPSAVNAWVGGGDVSSRVHPALRSQEK